MEHKIINVEKLTDNKYLNMYNFIYSNKTENEESTKKYNVASRREEHDLAVNNANFVDAVRVLTYELVEGRIDVVLIKEFRYAINDFIYSCPAGLIDEGEDALTAGKREVMEEIGGKIIKIYQTELPSYSSVGMTDERLAVCEAQVTLTKHQHLGESEDISIEIVPLINLNEFLDTHNVDLQSRLQLRSFYYKIVR